jgi:hypothetical protein
MRSLPDAFLLSYMLCIIRLCVPVLHVQGHYLKINRTPYVKMQKPKNQFCVYFVAYSTDGFIFQMKVCEIFGCHGCEESDILRVWVATQKNNVVICFSFFL